MSLSEREMLRRLGAGQSIAAVCEAAGITRDEFNTWWQGVARSRQTTTDGTLAAALQGTVSIERDRWGIPHIYAGNDRDLFFGFGFAMAQDRLFQLDYLRRKGAGRLSEILGRDGLPMDTIARTVGLNRIALDEWRRLTRDVQQTIESFSDGANALIDASRGRWPIEFDLLDYEPEPWSPTDCLVIESEFRWYLTGRFPIIVIPELAKRALPSKALYEEFVLGEADSESILHVGEYTPRSAGEGRGAEPVGHVMGGPDDAIGSNNWVVAAQRSTTGAPLVASDPHIAFEAVSCWYEAHLCGGSLNVAGMAYAGIPAIMFGRNERVAWGITNNICSQRDLYQEKTDPAHPDCFLYDGRPEPARAVVEEIKVRGSESIRKTIRFSRNGPVVNEILPVESQAVLAGECVTLKWLGAYQGGWLTAVLAMDRAKNVAEFREAMRPWHVPTFSLVIADVAGDVAYQSSGRIPIRKFGERAFRPGWQPDHQWQGLIPFESMPHVINPPRGWIATANNRPAPDDFPYSLFGCWSAGWRAIRIRQMLEAQARFSLDDMRAMQQDTVSLRAASLVPPLLSALESSQDARVREACAILSAWDFRVEPSSVAATIFNVFFSNWCRQVAAERFDEAQVELMSTAASGIAGRLLFGDHAQWFAADNRAEKIESVFARTLSYLAERFGADMSTWSWGRLHRRPLKHVLAFRGELASLLDQRETSVSGDMVTVCNTGSGPDWKAVSGAGYRLVADLASSPPTLWAVDAQSQSGHPGSAHYDDQFDEWLNGRNHAIHLDRAHAAQFTVHKLTLTPRRDATE